MASRISRSATSFAEGQKCDLARPSAAAPRVGGGRRQAVLPDVFTRAKLAEAAQPNRVEYDPTSAPVHPAARNSASLVLPVRTPRKRTPLPWATSKSRTLSPL